MNAFPRKAARPLTSPLAIASGLQRMCQFLDFIAGGRLFF
jgi:hypothetical protein